MTSCFIAAAHPACADRLAALAPSRGWLSLGPWPWRFHGDSSRGWLTPNGASVYAVEHTHFGVFLLRVVDDTEGLAEELGRLFELEPLDVIARAFDSAVTDEQKVRALLQLAAAQSFDDGQVLAPFDAAVRKALDDAHPGVRLTAIRVLSVAPRLGHELLENREDPDNPGIAEWRELFASDAAGGEEPE
jgi:hypothetical protein